MTEQNRNASIIPLASPIAAASLSFQAPRWAGNSRRLPSFRDYTRSKQQ